MYMWSESMGAKGPKLGGLKRHTAAGRHHTNMFVSVVVVFLLFFVALYRGGPVLHVLRDGGRFLRKLQWSRRFPLLNI